MNMKKIMAGVVASVAAVAMAVTASAVTITSSFETDDLAFNDSGIYKLDLKNLDGVDYLKVAGATVTITYDDTAEDAYVGGAVVFTSNKAGWNQHNFGSAREDNDTTTVLITSGTAFTVQLDASPFVAEDEYAVLAFQGWDASVDYNVDAVSLLDAEGNVLLTVDANNLPKAAATEDEGNTDEGNNDEGNTDGEGETTTAPDSGNTSTPSDDKGTPDTGVEGVAVVAGLAIVAAGAVVVAKKRK